MSIATLKRKTQTKYNNMSVNSSNGGFSLNGTHRSQGYIGQTMLSRRFVNTPMKGNVAKGNGGCCGTYNDRMNYPAGILDFNDTNVVKSSVLDNAGQIRTHYRWIWRPQPFTSVKIGVNINTQQGYIDNLSKNTVATLNTCNSTKTCEDLKTTCGGLPIPQQPRQSGTVIQQPRKTINIMKDVTQGTGRGHVAAESQSQYIEGLAGGCNIQKTYRIPINRAPLPGTY